MAISKHSDGTTAALVLGTETTILDIATLGCFVLLVDLGALLNGEEIELVIYNKVLTGDTYKVAFRETYKHVQDQVVVQSVAVDGIYGVKATIKQTGGTGRAYNWSLHRLDT